MFAKIEKIAVADRTGAAILGAVTTWRGIVYLPWTPELSYTHPVEEVFPTVTWSAIWLVTGILTFVTGMVRPKSKVATFAWATCILLHLFFGLSMFVAAVSGHFDGYMSTGTCLAIAGLAVWGSAREKPVPRVEVAPWQH